MRRIIAIALGIAAVSSAHSALGAGPPKTGAASRYATQRGEDAVLRAAIGRFLGKTRNEYSQYQGTIADQAQAHLALADRPFAIALDGGFWLVSGRLPQDPQEKGAALIDPSGRVRAVGLLVFVGEQDDRSRYDAWFYVADGPDADGDLARIRRWRALDPDVAIKVTRIPVGRG